ncbi:MAG TPA: family 78 glycoside hydrolase catalytic domain, partial [Mariniphaga sp.]|nr:family 78 glycoside hydrolase catalytic domain [Mariniphaga sp.]
MENNNLNKTFPIINISFITIALLLTLGCNNGKKLAVDTLTDDGVAHWIGDGKPIPQHDSLFYLDDRAPLFRKEFDVTDNLKSAKLFITAAGYYYALLNGERVGQNMLDPAWTDFSKRIYYTEYDILDMLVPGNNCIDVTLGNGFYNPLPMRMWGKRNLREVLQVGRPAFIGKIVLEYKNGKTDIIGTDRSWKYTEGPILKNDVYLGEVYNAQYEPDGWHLTGFIDTSWQNANYSDGPGGKLMKSFFPPVQVTKQIDAVDIYSPQKDTYIVDMGVNFTGMYKMRLRGEYGDSIVFRLGERTYDDGSLNPMTAVCGQIKKAGMGGPGAPDIAWQTDTYIFGDQKEVWYQPEFTFHTFRYLEIKGLGYKPDLSDIKGLAINSNVDESNHFSSSSQLINNIQE